MSDDTTVRAPAVDADDPSDALDSLESADREIAFLLDKWRTDTATLEEGDDVDVRWQRGSAAKLLLQHFAVRESAKDALSAKLRADGHAELAELVEGDRAERRRAIATLDEESRQRSGINLNNPDVDRAVMRLGEIFDAEREDDEATVIPAVATEMGASGERDLPSARMVQATAQTHPSPEPGFTERVTPLKAVRALYQHLRGSPTGGTAPQVDAARDHLPGPGKGAATSPTKSSN
jgi:hypothetical protein